MSKEKTTAEVIADERKRIGEIQAYGSQFAANGGVELAAEVIADEGSIDDLQRKINDKLAAGVEGKSRRQPSRNRLRSEQSKGYRLCSTRRRRHHAFQF